MKNIIIICMLLVLLPLVSAEDDVFKQNTAFNYSFPCEVNNSACSGSTVCYVTMFNPLYNIILDNVSAINNNYFHTISFNEQNSTENGIYRGTIDCIDGSSTLKGTIEFKVTSSGDQDSRLLSIIFGIVAIVFILLYFAFNVDNEHYLLKILLVFLALALLILIPNTLINGEHSSLDTLYIGVIWLFRFFIVYVFLYFNYYIWMEKILVKLGILKVKPNGIKKQT